MTGDPRGMSPLQDLRTDRFGHEEGVGRSIPGIGLFDLGTMDEAISHVREATTRLLGRIVSGSSGYSSGEN